MIEGSTDIQSQLQQWSQPLPAFHLDPRAQEKGLVRFGEVARNELFWSLVVTDIGWKDELSISQMKNLMARTVQFKTEFVIVVNSLTDKQLIWNQVQSVRAKTIIFVGKFISHSKSSNLAMTV